MNKQKRRANSNQPLSHFYSIFPPRPLQKKSCVCASGGAVEERETFSGSTYLGENANSNISTRTPPVYSGI
jgi:hypothetical protein